MVASWLLDLTAQALALNPALSGFEGRVSDSGEGRWTLAAADEEGVPAHVLAAALFERFASRGGDEFRTGFSRRCATALAATWSRKPRPRSTP